LYYLTDYENSEKMLLASLNDLIRKNPGTVYVHNLSRFDSIFLTKILYDNFKVKPIYKDSKILSLTVEIIDGQKFKMVLKDSLLLLNSSLRSLGKDYNVQNLKGVFPYKFPNSMNLNYIGNKPDFSFYNDITIKEYEDIPKNE